jgi:hypothetical protein
MIRHLITLAPAVALLLCAAMLALWVRSYRVADVWRAQRYRSYDLITSRGVLTVQVIRRYEFEEKLGLVWGAKRLRTERPTGFCSRWVITHDWIDPAAYGTEGSFRFALGQPGPSTGAGDLGDFVGTECKESYLRFPCWLAALIFASLPLLWWVARVRRRSLLRRGCCLHCGYDLRASKGRCPECGRPISPTAGVME